ncbi:MAG TPA: hypothetical protein VK718_10585 [Ferruginibacter sp.]|jgi:hypothetical protein|nr:hypothetical protein [Ferruginibacter sp.]
MTLLQCLDSLLEKITITDKQTSTVSTTYNNIKALLLDTESNLDGERVFQNGSYDRDTIIRPLDDIDLFFVLKREEYENDFKQLPNPQNVLTKIKDYLNSTKDYKDKVRQDRPCVTIQLVDKKFDVLPCFGNDEDGYLIPNSDLSGWIFSNPVKHSDALTEVNKKNNKVIPLIRIIKYWNKENKKIIPSFHIEEIAISIFSAAQFSNFEEGIYHWFHNVQTFLASAKFNNKTEYDEAKNKLEKAKNKIDEANRLYNVDNKESEAIKIYKEVFGDKFPTISEEEAKRMNEAMKSGSLKMNSAGVLSAIGNIVVKPTKFFGDNGLG